MDDLTREFLLESQEGLDRMERGLTELESRPGDAELLAGIFRSVHTIKGTTGFLGFPRLEALAHAGENLLGLLRDRRLAANPNTVSGLLALLDRLRGILRSIETTGGEGAAGLEDRVMIARLEALERAADCGAAPEPAAVTAASAPARSAARKSRRPRSSFQVAPQRNHTGAAEAGPQRNELAAPPAPQEPDPPSASTPAEAASFPRPGAAAPGDIEHTRNHEPSKADPPRW